MKVSQFVKIISDNANDLSILRDILKETRNMHTLINNRKKPLQSIVMYKTIYMLTCLLDIITIWMKRILILLDPKWKMYIGYPIQLMAQLYIKTSIIECMKVNGLVILSMPNNKIDMYMLPVLQYTLLITLIVPLKQVNECLLGPV